MTSPEPRKPRNPRNRSPGFRGFRGFRGPVALLVVLLLAAPAAAHHEADPSAPYEFRNAEANAFGSIDLPAYTEADGDEAVALAVPITLHPEALQVLAFRYLVGFNLHSGAVRLDDVALTLDGKPVPFERDERSSDLQPRFILRGEDLPRAGPVDLLLSGSAVARADGQMHVGALAIAFDAGWGTLGTRDGGAGQAYAFTLLMADGHAAPGLAPNFQGMGNSAWALAPLALVVAVTALGLRCAWLRLHPAPPKAKPTKAAVPATVQAPVPAPNPAHVRTAARPLPAAKRDWPAPPAPAAKRDWPAPAAKRDWPAPMRGPAAPRGASPMVFTRVGTPAPKPMAFVQVGRAPKPMPFVPVTPVPRPVLVAQVRRKARTAPADPEWGQ